MAIPGFERNFLKSRYDVRSIREDEWHLHTGERTAQIIAGALAEAPNECPRVLNAGSGCHQLQTCGWEQVAIDLFASPLTAHSRSVCATVENLPFPPECFGAVVCVGEVLGYCDPARALLEFARVLIPAGILICDFGSTRSGRYWFTRSHGLAADLISDQYNGSVERIWIYDPQYIKSMLNGRGFRIRAEIGIHVWSAAARRMGFSPSRSVLAEKFLSSFIEPNSWADVMTLVAQRR